MALPKILKHFNLFGEGNSYRGEVEEIVLPKLTRKMEDWQGGGMSGPIGADMGQEGMELEWTAGGFMRDVCAQYGTLKHDGVMLRFAGALQSEDSDGFDSLEIVVRGRHKEIDMGSAKSGEKAPFKVTTKLSYYKLTYNGEDLMEFDFINMVEKIGGNDLLTKARQIIGI